MTTNKPDSETVELRMQLRDMNSLLFVHAVECAYPEGDGVWAIKLGQPHGNEQLHKQFMSQILRSVLTPEQDKHRNGLIRQAIADTTDLAPFDEGDSS